jgi:hypothetical protein
MSIVLPALAVAFAAFCIWLGVRVYNRRERWAKRTLAGLLSLPVVYLLSMGPACWCVAAPMPADRSTNPTAIVPRIYYPVGCFVNKVPSTAVNDALDWWLFLGVESGHLFCVPADPEACVLIHYAKP